MQDDQTRWRRWWRPDLMLAIVAVATGVGGAWLARQYLDGRIAAAEEGMARRFETARVVVASSDLLRGQRLDGRNLAVREIPAEFVPANALRAEEAARAVGRALAVDVSRGTPIASSLVSDAGPASLSSILQGTQRALTLTVDELTSHAGGLRAGDRVDLYYSQRQDRDAMLVPLLQRVEVLATGDSILRESGMPDQFSTITVRVDVGDAPKLLLAQESGSIAVLLRSPADDALQAATIQRSSELLQSEGVRRGSTGIELFTGGNGGTPERSWMRVGVPAPRGAT